MEDSNIPYVELFYPRRPWLKKEKHICVEYRAQIQKNSDGGARAFPIAGMKYSIVLCGTTVRPSCRFFRKFGSHRFLRVRCDHLHDAAPVPRCFCIRTRVFNLLYVDEADKFVMYFATSDDGGGLECDKLDEISVQFVRNWHITPHLNSKLTLSKYNARFSQGFSSTFESPFVVRARIIDDIKSTSGAVLTDGCGFISKSLMNALLCKAVELGFVRYPQMGLEVSHSSAPLPSAVQARIGPAKGLFLIKTYEKGDEDVDLWVRASQIKWEVGSTDSEEDPSSWGHFFLEVLTGGFSFNLGPANLNQQFIAIMEAHGVQHQVFADLAATAIQGAREAWRGPRAIVLNKILGHLRSKQHAAVEFSKSSLEAEAFHLLNAGFSREDCAHLNSILESLLKRELQKIKEKSRIPVKKSARAFVVPDPFSVLKPNEIFFRPGFEAEPLTGSVILARSPCLLISDIRKYTGVDHPKLKSFTNVIVMSTHSSLKSSAASYLSGGDYDGDEAVIFYDLALVDPIVNQDLPFEIDVHHNLLRDQRVLGSLNAASVSDWMIQRFQSNHFLGLICFFHQAISDKFGIPHEISVHLAKLAMAAMDAPKAGYQIPRPDLPELRNLEIPHYSKNAKGKSWRTYKSKSALGMLFDCFDSLSASSSAEEHIPKLDPDLANEFTHEETTDPLIQHALIANESAYGKMMQKAISDHSDPTERDLAVEEAQNVARRAFGLIKRSSQPVYCVAAYIYSFNKNPKKPSTYAWVVGIQELMRIKADALARTSVDSASSTSIIWGYSMAPTICPNMYTSIRRYCVPAVAESEASTDEDDRSGLCAKTFRVNDPSQGVFLCPTTSHPRDSEIIHFNRRKPNSSSHNNNPQAHPDDSSSTQIMNSDQTVSSDIVFFKRRQRRSPRRRSPSPRAKSIQTDVVPPTPSPQREASTAGDTTMTNNEADVVYFRPPRNYRVSQSSSNPASPARPSSIGGVPTTSQSSDIICFRRKRRVSASSVVNNTQLTLSAESPITPAVPAVASIIPVPNDIQKFRRARKRHCDVGIL